MANPPNLPKYAVSFIHGIVDGLFDAIKAKALGPKHAKDKALIMGWKRDRSFAGLFEWAVREDGTTKPDVTPLDIALRVTAGYLDAERERMKAQFVQTIQSHLFDAHVQDQDGGEAESDLELGLKSVWNATTQKVSTIISAESNTVRNLGLMDGILGVNADQGIADPTVYFITARDSVVCLECERLHTLDGVIPRVWKLSEVGASYHKRGESNPKLPGLHPHCFTGSMRIHTSEGMPSFRDLFEVGREQRVVVDDRVRPRRHGGNQFGAEIPGSPWFHRHASGSGLKTATSVYETGVQSCLRITLTSGQQLEVSAGHEMWVDDGKAGGKVRADSLKVGDKVPLLSGPGWFGTDHFPDEAELMGNLLGDGALSSGNAHWNFFADDIEYGLTLLAKLRSVISSHGGELGRTPTSLTVLPPDEKYRVSRSRISSVFAATVFTSRFGLSKSPRAVPKRLWTADKETVAVFLRGLYSADGHSEGGPGGISVVLAQNELPFLREIQGLLSNFGLRARIFDHGEADTVKYLTYSDGRQYEVERRACWRMCLGGWQQACDFTHQIGFGVPRKQRQLEGRLQESKRSRPHGAWRTSEVSGIEEIGDHQTYCLTEPMTNTVTVNGIVTGNCRCVLATCLPSMGFSADGHTSYIKPRHDEYAHQHSMEKSEPPNSIAQHAAAVRRFARSSGSYGFLPQESTWGAGGCGLLAEASLQSLGRGNLAGFFVNGQLHHVVHHVDGTLIDQDGATSPEAWARAESMPMPEVRSLGAEHVQSNSFGVDGQIPRNQTTSSAISAAIRS